MIIRFELAMHLVANCNQHHAATLHLSVNGDVQIEYCSYTKINNINARRYANTSSNSII